MYRIFEEVTLFIKEYLWFSFQISLAETGNRYNAEFELFRHDMAEYKLDESFFPLSA